MKTHEREKWSKLVESLKTAAQNLRDMGVMCEHEQEAYDNARESVAEKMDEDDLSVFIREEALEFVTSALENIEALTGE